MTPFEFEKKARKLETDSKEYAALLKEFEFSQANEKKAAIFKHKAINRILDLLQPIRGINRSKLSQCEIEHLIEIGKAA